MNEETTMQNTEESNVAVLESEETQTQTKKTAKKRDRKAEKLRREAKQAEKQASEATSEAIEETQATSEVEVSDSENASHVASEVKRHKDVAQFEKVALYLMKCDARKSVTVASIKQALDKQIETYRFAVYLWELTKKAGAQIEKTREKRTVTHIRLLNKDAVRKYLKTRFPDMKF